jgi:hypothetical protein
MSKTEWALDMVVNINIWICQMALGRVNARMFAPNSVQVMQMLESAPQASMKVPRWIRCKYAHVMSVGFLHCGNAPEAAKMMQYALIECLPADLVSVR